MPGAEKEAEAFLQNEVDTLQHLDRVARLIHGFETPYGVELLATLLWLSQENPEIKSDFSKAVQGFSQWNDRKKEHFRPEHIKIAWDHLQNQGWM